MSRPPMRMSDFSHPHAADEQERIDLFREAVREASGQTTPDPSPEEIRQATEEIRSGWDEQTRRLRTVGAFRCLPVEVPRVGVSVENESITGVGTFCND